MKKYIALTLLFTGFLCLKAESDIVGAGSVDHGRLNRIKERAERLADQAKATTDLLLKKNQETEELKKQFAAKEHYDKNEEYAAGLGTGVFGGGAAILSVEHPETFTGLASKAATGLAKGAEAIGAYIPSLESAAGKAAKTVGGVLEEASPVAIAAGVAVTAGLLAKGAVKLSEKARDLIVGDPLSPQSQEEAAKLAQQAEALLNQAQQNIGQVDALTAIVTPAGKTAVTAAPAGATATTTTVTPTPQEPTTAPADTTGAAAAPTTAPATTVTETPATTPIAAPILPAA
jgi:hypothetical protein